MPNTTAALATAVVVFGAMLLEWWYSRGNERALRARGAIEPHDDVYGLMAWAYPSAFAAMIIEGGWLAPDPGAWRAAGFAMFVAGKALKYWAIASLGPLWSFRVLVLPGEPLVTRGPYAWMRHPNYAGIIGELVGTALFVGAFVTGAAGTAAFALVLRLRIAVEERALKRQSFTRSSR